MHRALQLLLIASTLVGSWLGFLLVHEFGHAAIAWATGGAIAQLRLHPLEISWSAFAPNPRPLWVAWGGPVLGSLLPTIVLAIAHVLRSPGFYLARFFAGFCLVANGLYLGVDAFARSGDAGTLLRHGAERWELLLFASVTVPLGFRLWHGLGPSFGLGEAHGQVSRRAAFAVPSVCALIFVLELAFAQGGS